MNFKPALAPTARQLQAAFSMVEVAMGAAIMGIVFVALYAGMSSGFAMTKVARENLRATQIMLERMEGLRLYNWEQLVYSNLVPTTFTNYYYPLGLQGNSSNRGIEYRGTMTVSNAVLSPGASYADRMRLVQVTVRWQSGSVERTRAMSTYASQHGIQNYVYYK